MNIDSEKIIKDPQLKDTVERLLNKFGGNILIKDFWEADLCAIGLSNITESRLIYISIFGLSADRFNVVIENLSDDKENQLLIGEFIDISYDSLENILIDHLMIK